MSDTPRNVTDSAPLAQDAPLPPREHQWRAVRAGGRICDDCLQTQVRGKYDDTPNCPGTRP